MRAALFDRVWKEHNGRCNIDDSFDWLKMRMTGSLWIPCEQTMSQSVRISSNARIYKIIILPAVLLFGQIWTSTDVDYHANQSNPFISHVNLRLIIPTEFTSIPSKNHSFSIQWQQIKRMNQMINDNF